MKLNGWKRIGTVASIIWILGAGAYTLTTVQDAQIQFASSATIRCEEAHDWRSSAECDALSTDYLAKVSPWPETAVVALVPVPLGWGFAYLILSLVRWIKRGFTQQVP
jgi:hypothetical protein